MKLRFILILLFVFCVLFSGCSSEPCDDLKNKAESCLDNSVKALLLSIANKGDKEECTDYLNSYYYTFGSRCSLSYSDAESISDIDTDR